MYGWVDAGIVWSGVGGKAIACPDGREVRVLVERVERRMTGRRSGGEIAHLRHLEARGEVIMVTMMYRGMVRRSPSCTRPIHNGMKSSLTHVLFGDSITYVDRDRGTSGRAWHQMVLAAQGLRHFAVTKCQESEGTERLRDEDVDYFSELYEVITQVVTAHFFRQATHKNLPAEL